MNFISELYQFVTRKRDENGMMMNLWGRRIEEWFKYFYKSHDIREEVIPNS